MAKKEPKYTVEKRHSDGAGSDYWVIWMDTADAVFWNEDSAILTCNALNAFNGIKKLKMKAIELERMLQHFNSEE